MSNSARLLITSKKHLSDAELDERWDWYNEWLVDDDDIPELDEENYDTITNMIEELFEHIHYLEGKVNRLGGEMLDALNDLRKDVKKFENRKRKATGSVEAVESKAKKSRGSRK